jgi:hypothetical protein
MTDKTNVITVTDENLTWINGNVPGKSKKERLENILLFYKTNGGPRTTDNAGTTATGEAAPA